MLFAIYIEYESEQHVAYLTKCCVILAVYQNDCLYWTVRRVHEHEKLSAIKNVQLCKLIIFEIKSETDKQHVFIYYRHPCDGDYCHVETSVCRRSQQKYSGKHHYYS